MWPRYEWICEDMEQVIAQRRLEIVSCLSAGYMRVRVAVIRTWVHFCVEVKGVSPWRMHWPKDESDDALMASGDSVDIITYSTWRPNGLGLSNT